MRHRVALLFLLLWDDEGNPRQRALELFDAFGSKEKTLQANMGGPTGTPWFEVHAVHLCIAAVGALLAARFLLDVVPYWARLLLGVLSGAVGLFAGMTMDGVGVDLEPWTVRERSLPSLRQAQPAADE